MTGQDNIIELRGVDKSFEDTRALEGIDLSISNGEFLTLLGPSGCGKTTILRILSGFETPDQGDVSIGGQRMNDVPPERRQVNTVFQNYALYPHLKVIDNIAFPLKQKGMPKAERHEKARQMARKLQIEHLLDRMPGELSGGQQQRVSMARALVKEPQVLLLDEPMSNLDARLKIEIRDEIRRIQQNLGVTSIIVTHDQEEAMAMADKIAILDNGRIQQFDTPEMLYHKPANLFVAHFMGNPPMNFIDASVEEEDGALWLRGGSFRVKAPAAMAEKLAGKAGQAVVIGVRSHQMNVLLAPAEETMELHLSLVENLGKDIMISGDLDGALVRVTIPANFEGSYEQLRELRRQGGSVYLKLHEDYNIFDRESGVNLLI